VFARNVVEQIDRSFFGILLGLLHLIQYKRKKANRQKKNGAAETDHFLKRLLYSSPQLANKFIHTDKFLFCPVRILLNKASKDMETLSIYIDLIHTQKSLPLLRCHSNPGPRVSLVDDSEGGNFISCWARKK
jgi:hypothetical protein